MKFDILRASGTLFKPLCPVEGAVQDTDGDWTIEINTLEELLALQEKVGADLIVNSGQIWIYDDYME